MSKSAIASVGDVVRATAAGQQAVPDAVVNNVFKVMHGFYGNLFLSKFATGEVDAEGHDKGVVSARHIWGHGLREFDGEMVKTALARCMNQHPEFPPSLPQFVALCAASKPRETYKPEEPRAIGMSGALVSRYAANARSINAKHAERAKSRHMGLVKVEQGLDGLKSAIANAVATAGGDEVAELRRLDRMFERRAA